MNEEIRARQIVLEPEQYEALEQIAAREGHSVDDEVREIVRRYLEEHPMALARAKATVPPLAVPEQRSAADCVEEVVGRYLEELTQREFTPELQVKIVEEVRRCRELLPQDHYDSVEVLNLMRAERDARNLGLISDCD
jgi:plasmid stability protein